MYTNETAIIEKENFSKAVMKSNPNFYPTPNSLIQKMISRIDFDDVTYILEPSAGAGHIVDALNKLHGSHKMDIKCIEIDPELQTYLRGKKYNVIDSDFLQFNSSLSFDLIIANFPFSDGEHHLLKAIDILFSGQIVCLLNAETLKNPYSNYRIQLNSKLKELCAEITFLTHTFMQAERPTRVEVALIYIKKEAHVETEVFNELKKDKEETIKVETFYELENADSIGNLVKNYEIEKELVIGQIISFYKNYSRVSKYLDLKIESDFRSDHADVLFKPSTRDNLTLIMKEKVNFATAALKFSYWKKVLDLPEIKNRLPTKQRDSFFSALEGFIQMEFSESNIRSVAIYLIDSFPKNIKSAVEDLFNEFTSRAIRSQESGWGYEEYSKNIHYFNAWATNDGFKINKKVIVPFYTEINFTGGMSISYKQRGFLHDLDIVISYFSAKKLTRSSESLVEEALKNGQNRDIKNEYFKMSVFKKGTIHIEFLDEDILRRFNIEACKLKNMLPMDYATKDYNSLQEKDKNLVKSFEGEKNYVKIGKEASVLLSSIQTTNLLTFQG